MDREARMNGAALRRALLIAALLGGALAPFAGSPFRRATAAAIDVQRVATAVEREEDHVTAIELARWIRDRKPNLDVVDLRGAGEFQGYHVPSARNLPLPQLIAAPPFAKGDTLVLISDGGAHAAQAWVLLQALGYRDVYFLRGGLAEWLDDVMSPAAASPEVAELSRYFGGSPRATDARSPSSAATSPTATAAPAAPLRERIAAMRRRGC
jgi:rhodanese-related sulfurtransferase